DAREGRARRLPAPRTRPLGDAAAGLMAEHIVRVSPGQYALRLAHEERTLLRSLLAQLRDLLGTEDASLRRVFPPAYDDAEAERGYRELMRDELVTGRREALETVERTLDAKRLSEDELTTWLGPLNDLRLVLGTRLGVTEELYERPFDPSDPDAPTFALYGWVRWVPGQAVPGPSAPLGQPPSRGGPPSAAPPRTPSGVAP